MKALNLMFKIVLTNKFSFVSYLLKFNHGSSESTKYNLKSKMISSGLAIVLMDSVLLNI